MRKALIVGIDHYDNIGRLYGCVNDALAVKQVLERHGNATRDINFTAPRVMVARNATERIPRAKLRAAVEELFKDDVEVALFYFSGHGTVDATGGFLCPSDFQIGDVGLSLADVLTFANASKAQSKVIFLDSCHSGFAGGTAMQPSGASLARVSAF